MLFSHPYIYSHTSIHPYIHPEWGALLGAAGSHWGLINKVRELFIYFSENILLSFWQTWLVFDALFTAVTANR